MMKGVAEFESMNFIPRLFNSSQHWRKRICSFLEKPPLDVYKRQIRGMGVPKLTAIGNRMGIIMAMVPALVPVEKEMIQVKRNATAEKMAGAINLVSREERYPAVPSWLIIPLSV